MFVPSLRFLALSVMQSYVGEWGKQTFPESTPLSIAAHLQEECKELHGAVSGGQEQEIREECADVLLLLLHIAERSGFDLQQAAEEKFRAIKDAAWTPTPQGYWKRVKP